MTFAPLLSPRDAGTGLQQTRKGHDQGGDLLVLGSFLWDRTNKCLSTPEGVPLLRCSVVDTGRTLMSHLSPYPSEWALDGSLASVIRRPAPTGRWTAATVDFPGGAPARIFGTVNASLLGFRQEHIPSPFRVIGDGTYCWLEDMPPERESDLSEDVGADTHWPMWFLCQMMRDSRVALRSVHGQGEPVEHLSGVVTDLIADARAGGVVFVGLCRSVRELARLFDSNSVEFYRLNASSGELSPLGVKSRKHLHSGWCGDRLLVAESREDGADTKLVDVLEPHDSWYVRGTVTARNGVPGRVGSWTCAQQPGRLSTASGGTVPVPEGWRLVAHPQPGLDVSAIRSRSQDLRYVLHGTTLSPEGAARAPICRSQELSDWTVDVHSDSRPSNTGAFVAVRHTVFTPNSWGAGCALRVAEHHGDGVPLLWLTSTGMRFVASGGAIPEDREWRRLASDDIHWRHASSRPVYELIMTRPGWSSSATFADYLDGITDSVHQVLRHHRLGEYILGGYSFGAALAGAAVIHGRLRPAHVVLRSGAYDRMLTPEGFQWERRSLFEAPDVYCGFTLLGQMPAHTVSWTIEHGYDDSNPGTPWNGARAFWSGMQGIGQPCVLMTGHGVGHQWTSERSKSEVIRVETESFGTIPTDPATASQ